MRNILISIIAFLLLASPAFGLSELKHTVCPSGCDYSNLSGAIEHLEASHTDLVSADVWATVEISGDWTSSPDTTYVGFTGVTTDSTHYVHVYTTGAARHDGIWGNKASAYQLHNSNQPCFYSSVMNLRVEGIQFQITSTVADGFDTAVYWLDSGATIAADVRIYENIFKGVFSGSSSKNGGIFTYSTNNSTTKTIRIWNNIFFDIVNSTNTHAAIWMGGDANTGIDAYAYNNTIQNTYDGIWNEAANGSTSSYNNGILVTGSAYVGTVSGKTGDSTSTPTFVNESGDDFHLSSGDTTWKDQTSDQSGGFFSDDIDGDTRSGSWDIGADEVISAAGGQVIMVN